MREVVPEQMRMLPDISEFYEPRSPQDFSDFAYGVSEKIGLAEALQSGFEREDPRFQAILNKNFLSNKAKEYEKTVQEALVAVAFSLRLNSLIVGISKVRMIEQQTPLLDFELETTTGVKHEFEVTTAYDKGRKIKLDYEDGKGPGNQIISGPANPWPIAQLIRDKTRKKRDQQEKGNRTFQRHLLVYQNILSRRGGTDLTQLRSLVSDVESDWASIWLVIGVSEEGATGVALLYPSSQFECTAGQWLS